MKIYRVENYIREISKDEREQIQTLTEIVETGDGKLESVSIKYLTPVPTLVKTDDGRIGMDMALYMIHNVNTLTDAFNQIKQIHEENNKQIKQQIAQLQLAQPPNMQEQQKLSLVRD